MTKKIPAYLRLHTESRVEVGAGPPAEYAALDALCREFRRATGWPVRYQVDDSAHPEAVWAAPDGFGREQAKNQLVVEHQEPSSGSEAPNRTPLETAKRLAAEVGRLLSELERARRVVWEREAELAAGVPITPRPDEEEHLAVRLQAVLRAGADAVGCSAAAIYLLDEGTSQLKLRASWGLPQERFLEPARPLRGAVADLEALVGHAVVLENTALLPNWRPPEQFASAVCVPISTPTTPLGTLWVFGDQIRDFTSVQTNIIEIVAGRVAAELEREMLLQQGVQARQLDRRLLQAGAWQTDRLPRFAPLLDGWDLAGWTSQADCVGGDFHDWSVLSDGTLAVAVGNAEGEPIEASLTAAALQTAVRCHGCYPHNARQLLGRVNETLWTGSVGGQLASLFYGLVQPESGDIDCAFAGRVAAILARPKQFELLAETAPPLGASPELADSARRAILRPGDVLLVLSEGAREARDEHGRRLDERTMAHELQRRPDAPAEQLIDALRELLAARSVRAPEDDWTLLVIKRRA